MRLKDRIFPYPVLGLNDDISSHIELLRPLTQTIDDRYIIEWGVDVQDKDILDLIKEGKAQYVCEIECQRTFYRKCISSDMPHFKVEILKDNVAGKIEFQTTITVKEPIHRYTNSNFHEDYLGYSFDLEPGDLLACFDSFVLDADIRYERLQAIGSFMLIENAGEDKHTSVFLDDNKIKIRLPKDMFDMYRRTVGQDKHKQSIIHSSLVFNALLQALYSYAYVHSYSQFAWAKALKYRLQNDENLAQFKSQLDEDEDEYPTTPFDKDKIYEFAQALLGEPYEKMFKCIETLK